MNGVIGRLREKVTYHFVCAMYRWFLCTDENKWKSEAHIKFASTYLDELNDAQDHKSS